MVERKTARRISSLFSLVSNSSEKGTEVTKSSSSLSLAGLSRDSANAQNLRLSTSDIRIETPPPNENGFDHGLSPAQTPQYDPGRLAPSPEPEPIVTSPENIVASPDLIATSPQEDLSLPSPQVLLPDTVHSQADSVLGSREEGRPRSRTECRVNGKTNSLVDHKRASRSGSPSKFLNPSTQLESILSKRKTWRPGKLRTTSQGGALESPLPQAWVLTPHDMIPYSILDLVNFHQVGRT